MNAQVVFAWHDAIGLIGVTTVLVSYFGLQAGWMKGDKLPYQIANILGALGILISLFYAFNLSSFVIQVAWIAISVYGIVRSFRNKADSEK